MSLSDPLTLKNSSGTDVQFAIQSVIAAKGASDPTGTVRVNTSSSPYQPQLLTVKQQVTGKGTGRVRRTLVSYTDERVSDSGLPSKMVVNLSIAFPLVESFSSSDVFDGIAIIGDLAGGTVTIDNAKVTALLQGQS